eukprot:scaffold76261_cov33-Tisochrysis_lutea.AAC.8
MRAVTAIPWVRPIQLTGSMPKATRVEPSPSESSVRAELREAANVCPRAPNLFTDLRASRAVQVWPMPESEPKSPHVSAPQPRNSRAKTCQVSPIAMEIVCSPETALNERSSGPERNKRRNPNAGGRSPNGERAEHG